MCEKCRKFEAEAGFKMQMRICIGTAEYGARLIGEELPGEIGGAIDLLMCEAGTGVNVAFKTCELAIFDDLPEGFQEMAAVALRHMATALEMVKAQPQSFEATLMHPNGTPVCIN